MFEFGNHMMFHLKLAVILWFLNEHILVQGFYNLAFNRPAYQKATYMDYIANKSVDGNTNGHMVQGKSCSHTPSFQTEEVWWEVDLGLIYQISYVKVFNRNDCCEEYTHDLHLLLGKDRTDYKEYARQVGYFQEQFHTFHMTDVVYARWVRLVTEGKIICICEVQVLGDGIPQGTSNVALNQPAYQKATYMHYTADRSVDGNTNGHFDLGHSCSSTRNVGGESWWEVDLGHFYKIVLVKVFNRNECCQEHTHDLHLLLGKDRTDYIVYVRQYGQFIGDYHLFELTGLVYARWVRLYKETGFIAICEVMVFGEAIPTARFGNSVGKLGTGRHIEYTHATSRTVCCMQCMQTVGCCAINYHEHNGTCELLGSTTSADNSITDITYYTLP